MRRQLLGMTGQEEPAGSYWGAPAGISLARPDSKPGVSVEKKHANLNEHLTCRFTIFVVVVAGILWMGFQIVNVLPSTQCSILF
jgi:hypothetical protein